MSSLSQPDATIEDEVEVIEVQPERLSTATVTGRPAREKRSGSKAQSAWDEEDILNAYGGE